MRLDKYLSELGILSRKETALLAKKGGITVDGVPVRKPDAPVIPGKSRVCVLGSEVEWHEHWYLMLNKPAGYVSSTDDPGAPTVMELLPERYRKLNLFPCGRLDRNTTGLLLLTDDGPLAHRLLAPKSHVRKCYSYQVKFPLSEQDIEALEAGIEIEGGYVTMPCCLISTGERSGIIEIHEGKYHQIKLMMKAVHNQITSLRRVAFGPLVLDPCLGEGKWRELDEEEIALLKAGREDD